MIKVLFVCHGNICRSPMAEFVFKDIVKKEGKEKDFYIDSKATSSEEIGNGVHYGTIRQLKKHNILGFENKRSQRICRQDYDYFDYIIVMDSLNMRNIGYVFKDVDNKIHKLLDYTDRKGDIADPWYTGDFELTFKQINEGCIGLFNYITKRN